MTHCKPPKPCLPFRSAPLEKIVLLILLLSLSAASSAFAGENRSVKPWEYRLGEGFGLADTNYRLGGYSSLKYDDAEDSRGRFTFDDLSLFLFGDITERLRFFSEAEDAHFWSIDTDGNTDTEHDFALERLYVDYLLSDSLNFRLGKFLLPIGTWNEIHADPLVWTVSRPLVTRYAFPQQATGLQIYGNLTAMDQDMAYAVFMQKNDGIDERSVYVKSHDVYGGRVRWFGQPGLEIGIPVLYYSEYKTSDNVYLTGFDVTYKQSDFEIRSEWLFSSADRQRGGQTDEYGYYLQGVYGFTERHYAAVRHEYFKAGGGRHDHKALSIGGVYKLRPQIVFKAEYQARSGSLRIEDVNESERLLASFAILF